MRTKIMPPSPDNPVERPLHRSECKGGPRPCPLVGCPYNNYLTVNQYGIIRLSHKQREPEDVPPSDSCVLDVADSGPQTLERVGEILGLTRERIRQIEMHIVAMVRKKLREIDVLDNEVAGDQDGNSPRTSRGAP